MDNNSVYPDQHAAGNALQDFNNLQNTGTSNPRRTRITRACDTCRRKKIKCDVDSKHPCTTCRQYEWECTFRDTAKKRGPPKGYIESLETRLEKMEKLLKTIGDDEDADSFSINKKRRQSSVDPEQEDQEQEPLIEPFHQAENIAAKLPKKKRELNSKTARAKVVRYHGSSSGYYLVGNILSNEQQRQSNESLPPTSPQDIINSTGTTSISPQMNEQLLADEENQQKQKVFVVYNGRESYRLRRMNVNDNDLMVVRDATADEEAIQLAVDEQESIDDIIPRSILVSLVDTYFSDAHTTLPVIEKDEYMDAFEGRTSPPPAPLLTYAICTYSCFLLKSEDPIFKDNGVERDQVFQILLDRASSLVRKEYLKPRIVTIQALILMCGHPTYSTTSYRNWILAGMAVRMAQDLGLHRTLSTVDASDEYKEKRKRLWYSAYCTDRWCCAVMGRPLAIADSDCDVDLPLVKGPEANEDLTMFVNFVKLSGILGEILRRIYSPKAKLNGYKTKAMEQTVWSLHKMLEEWFANVPDGYKITEQDLLDMRLNPQLYQGSKKVTEGGPMTICYHAVVLLLHRPFVVLEKGDNDIPSLLKATELCTQAAKLATDVARAVPYMSIAKFGWNFSAYSVFQAALIHVYNCTSKDPAVAKQAKEYLDVCTNEILTPLSRDIPAGPPLISFLQTLSSLLKTDDNGNSVVSDASQSLSEQQQNQQQQQQQEQQEQSYQHPQVEQQQYDSQQQQPPLITPIISNNGYMDQSDRVDTGSWLLNGGNGGNSALTQAAWQQLFSTAGTPFSAGDSASGGFDVQGWDSFFMENQSSNNMFMP